MKRSVILPVSVMTVAVFGAQALTPTRVVTMPSESPNRLNVSLGGAFNVKTEFQNVGSFTSLGGTLLTPAGDAYNYDNGYVLTDSTGNLMGYTRYWGYNYDSGPLNQLPGDGTILMSRFSSGGATSKGQTEEPLPGIEINFSREIGRSEKWRWGIEVAGGYYHLLTRQSGSVSANVSSQTDAYQLPSLEGGGYVTPPPAPYAHGPTLSPAGNPVIGSTPISSRTDTFATTVGGDREFEADIFSLRLGPYLELPLDEKLSLTVAGGISIAYIGSDFRFSDQIALPGALNASGGGADNDLVWGGYVSGSIRYKVAEAWEISGGVQFQHLEKYSHQENSRAAVLDMGKAVMVTFGLQYSF